MSRAWPALSTRLRLSRRATGEFPPLQGAADGILLLATFRPVHAFLRHLEIYLTIAGLIVTFAATAWISPSGVAAWTVAAVSATTVGVLHGLIFWLVRRRQRQVREAALHDVRSMLNDIINNQLTVIQAMNDLHRNGAIETRRACDAVADSIQAINGVVHTLSEESLQRWKARYPDAHPRS